MKHTYILGAFLIVLLGAGSADAASYMKFDGVDGESADASTQTQMTLTAQPVSEPTRVQTTTQTDTDTDGEGAKKGNVEYTWKVEEGEGITPVLLEIDGVKGESTDTSRKDDGIKDHTWKLEQAQASRSAGGGGGEGKVQVSTFGNEESSEKGGTEDINIGVGENAMRGGISVAAGDIDGLTAEERQEFLAAAKAHAEVRSQQDLEIFAKGVLLEDEQVEQISLNFEKIQVKHQARAKLFGLFPLSIIEEVEVDTQGEDAGRVKVKLPWFSFLLSTESSEQELQGVVESEVQASEDENLGSNENWDFGVQARVLANIANALKARHDAAMNAVRNLK